MIRGSNVHIDPRNLRAAALTTLAELNAQQNCAQQEVLVDTAKVLAILHLADVIERGINASR